MDDETIAKIGDPITDPPPAVFELVLADHITWADPKEYGLDREGIKPCDYFVTSGDAVEKAKVLDKDLWHLAGSLRTEIFNLIAQEHECTVLHAHELFRQGIRPANPARLSEYESAIWKVAGQARKLLAALKLAKGQNCFLETEWDCHRLLCIPKNPRK